MPTFIEIINIMNVIHVQWTSMSVGHKVSPVQFMAREIDR